MQSSSIGHFFRDILFHVSSMQSFSFAHVVRQSNAAAHALVQRVRLSFPFFAWMESVLSDIVDFVIANIHIVE